MKNNLNNKINFIFLGKSKAILKSMVLRKVMIVCEKQNRKNNVLPVMI